THPVQSASAYVCEISGLDPSGSHGQGEVFLRRFMAKFGTQFGILDMPANAARVQPEIWLDSKSRVDILVETDDTRIVIENKIYARDQPGRLAKYHAYAVQRPNSKVVYLTLHGDPPSQESLGDLPPDEVALVSYESDVLAWLDDCVKEAALVPQVREILAHYQGLLRKLTRKSIGGLTMELKNLLAQKHEEIYNFELAPSIAEAMRELSVETEWAFWESMHQQLTQDCKHAWSLMHAPHVDDKWGGLKEVTRDVILHAHSRGQDKWYYGWTFRIHSETSPNRFCCDGVEVVLRVECEKYGWGRYGLIAAEQQTEGTYRRARLGDMGKLFGLWRARLKEMDEGWKFDDDGWLAWRYPIQNIDLRKTTPHWLAPEVIRAFKEHEGVAPLVEEIGEMIDTIEST
ncbi:MAG: PD-(D/E)XK nuclease family protein, partial [Rhodospirillaceae bacterium]|nr:PD-(D/E)XK nuclease family protein [Rhodospirillaceae bacterium]